MCIMVLRAVQWHDVYYLLYSETNWTNADAVSDEYIFLGFADGMRSDSMSMIPSTIVIPEVNLML